MTKIVLALAVTFLLYVGLVQNATIAHQRQTIWEMTQNPACMVAPFPPKPKASVVPNPMEPREQ